MVDRLHADDPTAAAAAHRRRQQVEQASQEWRAGLMDVSGSNRLLYFKRTASTLDLQLASPAALSDLLSGQTVALARLFADATVRASAQKACKALAAKQRETTEEFGIGVAYIALGMATWDRGAETGEALDTPSKDDDRGRRGGRRGAPAPPAAPVVLRPLSILTRRGATGVYDLALDGETLLNPVLAHVLAAKGIELSEADVLAMADDLAAPLGPLFDHLRSTSADVPGFNITADTLAGAFSYLKQPMVTDVEDVEALLASDLVAALAGDEGALEAVRSSSDGVREDAPDRVPVNSEHLVLDADSSQAFVVNAAVAGRNLVIQGPPGTGKSQTIANTVAALVAEGRSVLFVAQKRAAITAVLDRLDKVGLGELVLDMFAASGSRRAVTEQLRAVLDGQAAVRTPVTDRLHSALSNSRDRLVGHRDALHVARHGWGVTLHDALGLAYEAPEECRLETRLSEAVLGRWSPDQLQALADAASELAARGGLRPDLHTAPGWSAAHLTTHEALAAADEQLITLRTDLLPAHLDAVAALSAAVGGGIPDDPAGLAQVLDLLLRAAEAPTAALRLDLPDDELHRLLAATGKSYRRTHGVDLGFRARRAARRTARQLLGDDPRGRTPRTAHQALADAQRVREDWRQVQLPGAPREVPAVSAVVASSAALAEALDGFAPALQHLAPHELGPLELRTALGQLAGDVGRANLPRIHELETLLASAGCAALLTDLRRVSARHSPDPAGRWAGLALQHVAAMSVVERALLVDRRLSGISGADLTSASEEFTAREHDHLSANAARVRRAAAGRLRAVLDADAEQQRALRAAVGRKRQVAPVRRLLDEAPSVVLAAKPVWAMSPLQVSQLLPARQVFDVVIFDEASQVRPADAVPALLRGRQAIIAGDSKQLPPTEFFTKVIEHDDPEDLAAEAAEEDGALGDVGTANAGPPAHRPPGETLTRDAESILEAWDTALLGQSRTLRWHYRSRDERLIAVSNAHVYGHQLITVPAADTADALRHEVAEPSRGVRGGTNSPAAEVQRVVDLVLEHARERAGESLGVITLGLVHAHRVEAALDAALDEEPELRSALEGNSDEPFFVKNVERVQGDERDAVILSLGYGKGVDGKLPMLWGPLLKDGGQRRLNVAISRARRRMALVTSFEADDLADDAHSSQGYQLMRHLVRFMASDGTDIEVPTGSAVPLNPFEDDILRQLVSAGLDVVPQLGVGSYRLDFAVRHPTRPGRYVLAVEADGASYHSGTIARERDRLRQRLLEDRGWTFHRIWSTDWFNDARGCLAQVVAAYEAALGRDGGPAPAVPAPRSEAPAWSVAPTLRTVPRPRFVPGLSIADYDARTLMALARHLRSDGVLRTREEELTEMMRELGFSRRGQRIVAALETALARA